MRNHDRSVRRLTLLRHNASTSRVLNLHEVFRTNEFDPDYRKYPVFSNTLLNRSIILKHRLRKNEYDVFETPRTTGTKIMIPIDMTDLKQGAHYMFVGQIGFSELLETALTSTKSLDSNDLRILKTLDELPSFDPFLLREQLIRKGTTPAPCYFQLAAADIARMTTFAQKEVMQLVNLTFSDDPDGTMSVYSARLVNKILSSTIDVDLEPLRKVLQLTPLQFNEGIFCWKAFLYYKWQLSELLPRLHDVLAEISRVQPRAGRENEFQRLIETGRAQIRKRVANACREVRATLDIYDKAYLELTQSGKVRAFRNFLSVAPTLYLQLGERLGAVEHVASYWRYRFPKDRLANVMTDELCEIFADFENCLDFDG
jgi:hypothetical protein